MLKLLKYRNCATFAFKQLRTMSKTVNQEATTAWNYPIAKKDETNEEEFFGKKIKDHYRWLENPEAKETNDFIEEQNLITKPFLESCEQRQKIQEKLTKLWDYPKYGCPMKHGSYYYFFMNSGLQNQSVLYQQKSLNSEPVAFFDPNSLSADGTIALAQQTFSEDGNYMAYALSESGSDWVKIHIRNVETGVDFAETLEKVKFSSIAWTKDNKGFFYSCYPEQAGKTDGSETSNNENQKLYYHKIGKQQTEDILVAEFPEHPTWRVQSEVSDCGKYLILPIVKDCHDNILYYAKLDEQESWHNIKLHKIIDQFEADYSYVTNTGSKLFIHTNKNAPNYRIISIDMEQPDEQNWCNVIAEHERDVLHWAICVHENKLLLGYMRDVKSALTVNSLESGALLRELNLDIGSISGVSGKKKSSEIFYSFSSFLNPGTIYHHDFEQGGAEEPKVFREIKLNLEGFRREDYRVEQVFYNSKDGTKVPMFIVRKNSEKIEPRPCHLYGYGGFNISLQPSFSITGLMFINTFDGVLAYPNIRGGGEYGEKWHDAGRLLNKQNSFDDFQAAAKYLLDNKYTTKDRLLIEGGSNGGLLVGACINQTPQLFGAAVAHVGVLDMLRFHKFTIGHAWCSDYGNPDEKEHFENLCKFSPLHNVCTPKSAVEEYPSTLILTADHDDRVSPLHSLKFAAALQEAVRDSEFQKKPVLLRVYTKAGHGAGKPTSMRIEEATDILTFTLKSLNIDTINL